MSAQVGGSRLPVRGTESSTGRVNMAARWYNPNTGQFGTKDSVSVDPASGSAGANPFAYVGDNPLTGTDSTGHHLDNDPAGYSGPDCTTPGPSHICWGDPPKSKPSVPKLPMKADPDDAT